MQRLEYDGWFAGPNGRFFNATLSDREEPTGPASDAIVVVEIDDKAYENWFGRAPLENKPELVMSLVNWVVDAQPHVIGVDVLTEADGYKTMPLGARDPEIIWAANAVVSRTEAVCFCKWLLGSRDEILIMPGKVLGYEPGDLDNHPEIVWGVPVYPPDPDSTIRRFPRRILDLTNGQRTGSWASLIAKKFCGRDCGGSGDEIYISYRGAPVPRLNASDFLKPGNGVLQPLTDEKRAAFQYFLKRKVVLIGASSNDISFSDMHDTPMGRLPGVVVNAYAVRAEINASKWALHEVKQPGALFLDFAVGIFIVLIFYDPLFDAIGRLVRIDLEKNEFRWKIGVSTVLLVVFAVIFGLTRGQYIIGFVGVGLGVLLHQIAEVFLINPQRREESH